MNIPSILSFVCFIVSSILFFGKMIPVLDSLITGSWILHYTMMVLPIIGIILGLKAGKWKVNALGFNALGFCIFTITGLISILAF